MHPILHYTYYLIGSIHWQILASRYVTENPHDSFKEVATYLLVLSNYVTDQRN